MLELWSKKLLGGEAKAGGMFFIVDTKNDASTSLAYTNYMYSYDGLNWEVGNFPFANMWKKVAFGNGVYIAVGCSNYTDRKTNKYAYSTDGINWKIGTFPRTDSFFSVAFGNGIFVVVAASTSGNLYSADGINWDTGDLSNGSTKWGNVVFNNGLFHALNYASLTYNYAAYSTDGISWAYTQLSNNIIWTTILYGNGVFCLIPRPTTSANVFKYSYTGASWNNASSPANGMPCTGACYFKGKFIGAVSSSSYQTYIWESANGTSWTSSSKLPVQQIWQTVACNDNICVLTAGSSNVFCYSTDGESWASSNLPLSLSAPYVFYCGE